MATIINAENCIAGRLASCIAKRLLNGEEIIVVNTRKLVISGNPHAITKFFEEKMKRGDPYHGPFYPKKPEGIFRRMVRGMLPFRKAKGREAYKKLKVYASIPEELKSEKFEVVADAKKILTHKFIYLDDVTKKWCGK